MADLRQGPSPPRNALEQLIHTITVPPEGIPLDLWLKASEVIEDAVSATLADDAENTLQPAIARALFAERKRWSAS